MADPRIVYIFNDAGDMEIHKIPGYIPFLGNYAPYLIGLLKEEYKGEKKAFIIEGEYFENKGLNFLIRSPKTTDLIWAYYPHAYKMREDIDALIEKAKAVHFLL